MAKITTIHCPECGARTNMDYDRKRCFCTYCGTELYFDDGSQTINYNATYRKIDEARITESENQKEIVFRQYDEQKKHDKAKLIVGAIVVIAWLISFLVLAAFCAFTPSYSGDDYHPLLSVDIVLGLIAIAIYFRGTRKNK